jgi:hypothetical protein
MSGLIEVSRAAWISAREVARRLGSGDPHLAARLSARGQVRVLRVEGMRVRYSASDVQSLISKALMKG